MLADLKKLQAKLEKLIKSLKKRHDTMVNGLKRQINLTQARAKVLIDSGNKPRTKEYFDAKFDLVYLTAELGSLSMTLEPLESYIAYLRSMIAKTSDPDMQSVLHWIKIAHLMTMALIIQRDLNRGYDAIKRVVDIRSRM